VSGSAYIIGTTAGTSISGIGEVDLIDAVPIVADDIVAAASQARKCRCITKALWWAVLGLNQ
jgi:hypothetical protein